MKWVHLKSATATTGFRCPNSMFRQTNHRNIQHIHKPYIGLLCCHSNSEKLQNWIYLQVSSCYCVCCQLTSWNSQQFPISKSSVYWRLPNGRVGHQQLHKSARYMGLTLYLGGVTQQRSKFIMAANSHSDGNNLPLVLFFTVESIYLFSNVFMVWSTSKTISVTHDSPLAKNYLNFQVDFFFTVVTTNKSMAHWSSIKTLIDTNLSCSDNGHELTNILDGKETFQQLHWNI